MSFYMFEFPSSCRDIRAAYVEFSQFTLPNHITGRLRKRFICSQWNSWWSMDFSGYLSCPLDQLVGCHLLFFWWKIKLWCPFTTKKVILGITKATGIVAVARMWSVGERVYSSVLSSISKEMRLSGKAGWIQATVPDTLMKCQREERKKGLAFQELGRTVSG